MEVDILVEENAGKGKERERERVVSVVLCFKIFTQAKVTLTHARRKDSVTSNLHDCRKNTLFWFLVLKPRVKIKITG